MKRIPFSEDELQIVGTYPPTMLQGKSVDKLNTPISAKENLLALLRNEAPLWLPNGDYITFTPGIVPDNVARGSVIEAELPEPTGGLDMFGVDWEYIVDVGGSMVRPGKPMLEDANDWKEAIKFPDIDSWDWEGCAERNRAFLGSGDEAVWITFYTGLFERLISFMDFENAAVAMIDEDQKEAVKALFSALCDLYEQIFDRFIEYFGMTGILFHDDWGSQKSPFFSSNTFREMILPYMQRLTSFCHDRNVIFELHSCGRSDLLIDAIVETGIDMWRPQVMNDLEMLYRDYGDKFKLGVRQPMFPKDATDEQKLQAAKDMVKKYSLPGRYVHTMSHFQDPVFRKALYKESRIAYNNY